MPSTHDIPADGRPDWLIVTPDLNPEGPLRPLHKKQLRRWELVLQARSVPYRTEPFERGRLLLVPAGEYPRAREELRLFEEENHNWPPPLPQAAPEQDNLLTTLCVLVALASFHNLTLVPLNLAGHFPVDWSALGNAHTGKILHGEWWRLVTALTLHADWLHLFGNLAIGGLFVGRLCRDLGAGLGWSLVLASGVLGNLVNAFFQHPAHRAVGASTAVFGAVGILAALAVLRYRVPLRKRWPIPIAAALALLAMLGSGGENTDLGAHLFGFLCGLGLGAAAEKLIVRYGRPTPNLNHLLAALSTGLVLLAWWLALG